MTLSRDAQAKMNNFTNKHNKRNNGQDKSILAATKKNFQMIEEAVILEGINVMMSKESEKLAHNSESDHHHRHDDEDSKSNNSLKFERKPSLRKKFRTLIKGSANLPTVINRGLRPIRRSLSFSKDLNRTNRQQDQHQHILMPFTTKSVQWYNSLSSLAEHDALAEEDAKFDSEQEIFHDRDSTLDSPSFIESSPVPTVRRRLNTGPTAPYGRYSDNYDFSINIIDLSKPPCEASSLPVLTPEAIEKEDVVSKKNHGWMEQQVKNGWENLMANARNLSFLHLSPKKADIDTVRSRSLTQLDALGTSMLDAGDNEESSTAKSHAHQQNFNESSPRFLVPNAPPTEGTRPNRTRHKLSRSQVSSSEYFSVTFEVGDDTSSLDREEFLPATKGTYLSDILGSACERRGIDLSRVDVLLENFSSPLLVQTTEASSLGGKHLRVVAKDEKPCSRTSSQRGNHNLSFRKTGSTYRAKSSGRFFSVSTEDSSIDSEVGTAASFASGKSPSGIAGAASFKGSKQRWSAFFTNTKGTKMELLVEQLNNYTKHGIPRLPDSLLLYDLANNEDELFSLEGDWRDIVENSELLSEKQQQQQTALWELAQTEAAYIKTLKVVTDLFMACLCGLQSSNILIEVDRAKLFSNIPEIYAANRYFWTEHIITMLHSARTMRTPLDPGHLLQGFESFEKIFVAYTRYCSEQSKCQQYCRDRFNDNDLFTAYLVWCETQKDCNRLRLLDILVKPMQRITKYSLLLKAIHKNTENEEQKAELTVMIKSVDSFVASVNAAMRRSEETARLAAAALRLESYDVIESKDEELEKLIKFHSNLDIMNTAMPGCSKDALRTLLREGDLKLRDTQTSKVKLEVHILLMTDMLLICKPSAKKITSSVTGSTGLKVVRQPFVIDRIRIHELKEPSSLGLVYLNEYGAATAAFILSAGEQKLAKSWMESIRKAQQQYTTLKLPPLGSTLGIASTSVSRQASTYLDAEFEGDDISEGLPRTPRGSSRASRVSSLAHSHSGSVEMEASPGSSNLVSSYNASRNVSVETTEPPRASSVSSEEGGEIASGQNHRTLQIRRSLLSKTPTPNTLSVHVPAYSGLGQSLPNLTLATSPQTSTVSPTPPSSLLIVPQITKSKETLLSPGHRGISYPPPSPPRIALRRAFAIPQSRHPPLIKTRHINAATLQTTVSLDTEAIEERRRRLEPSQQQQRMASTSSIAEEKK